MLTQRPWQNAKLMSQGPAPFAGAPSRPEWPRWTAHRGAGRLAPENTLAAFRLGAALGWRAFECDVQLSADGLPFLLHDTMLERTTNGCGRACDQPWAALARLDAGGWHSARYVGEPLPTLALVAAHVQAAGLALNIEIKPAPGQEAKTGLLVARACAGLWAHAGTPLLLSSFSRDALLQARDAAPQCPRALLLDHWPADAIAAALDLGCSSIVAQHRLLDARRIAALRASGLGVLAYTVNDKREARRMLELGVDSLISDAVDRLGPRAVHAGR